MSKSPTSAAEAAGAFVLKVAKHAPRRIEAKVVSPNGMPVLCAVEAVLRQGLPRPGTTHELVWLAGGGAGGGHVLQLKAFGRDGQVLAAAEHAVEG